MWVLVVLWFFLLLMIFIYYIFHTVTLFFQIFIVLAVWFSCGSNVVLNMAERTTKNPKNPKQNLCGSLEILCWQGLQSREPQEPQEPTFLFMYRVIENDSLNTWQPNQENPHYGKSLLRNFRMWLLCGGVGQCGGRISCYGNRNTLVFTQIAWPMTASI